ncbi:MAG: formylglycine-generating enzyme family protein [Chlorobium sp.]
MSWFTKIFGHKQDTPNVIIIIKGSTGTEAIFEFCPIHAGAFKIQSNVVKIDQNFYLGKYPVTQQQWEVVMGNNPSHFKGECLPVETVSWDDAQTFIQKLNTLSSKELYRLPTEIEWEYACRAGSTSAYRHTLL